SLPYNYGKRRRFRMSTARNRRRRMSSYDPAKPHLLKPAGKAPPTTTLGEATVKTEPKPSAWDGMPPEHWIGRTLGKYEITAVLGKGGMGVVFKARDP